MGSRPEGCETHERTGPDPSLFSHFMEKDRQCTRGGVPVASNVRRYFLGRETELAAHSLKDSIVGLMGNNQVERIDLDACFLANLTDRIGHEPDRRSVKAGSIHHGEVESFVELGLIDVGLVARSHAGDQDQFELGTVGEQA